VVSRPQLALVRGNELRDRVRANVPRTLAILAIVLAVIGLGYAAARFTSLFALRELDVKGGPPEVRAAVREAGSPFLGQSLVALDQDELLSSLAELPTVRSARIDRAFPHTLRIVVVAERALAVVRNGQESWLVSEQGHVIRPANLEKTRPVVWTTPGTVLQPGALVEDDNVRLALEGLRNLPPDFPEEVEMARAAGGSVVLDLENGMELRLGTAESMSLKLAVAGRVLRSLSATERDDLTYLDVSVPERVVGSATLDPQLEG
jgi:cell division protein FtsQ